MAQVNVTVNNRLYEIGCDDGEEDQVRRLSGVLDKRVRELAALVGQVGEARLMLMTALTLADDLEQAQRDVAEMRQAVSALQTSKNLGGWCRCAGRAGKAAGRDCRAA